MGFEISHAEKGQYLEGVVLPTEKRCELLMRPVYAAKGIIQSINRQ